MARIAVELIGPFVGWFMKNHHRLPLPRFEWLVGLLGLGSFANCTLFGPAEAQRFVLSSLNGNPLPTVFLQTPLADGRTLVGIDLHQLRARP